MAYDICIFDLDGTLLDPKEGIVKSYKYALEHFDIDENSENLTKFIGPPLRQVFTEHYKFSEQDCEKAVERFRKYFADKGILENTVYDGIFGLLEKVKLEGKTLLVATNKVTEYAKIILEHFGLLKYFDVVSGDDFDGTLSVNGKGKIIENAMEFAEVKDKSKIAMIGDRKNDILGAKDVGIDSIGILWGYGSREELKTAGATYIAKDVDEAFDIILK